MTTNNLNYIGNGSVNANVCSECNRAKRLSSNVQCNLAYMYQDHYNNKVTINN